MSVRIARGHAKTASNGRSIDTSPHDALRVATFDSNPPFGFIDLVLANFTITDERAKQVDFSIPYFSSGQQFLAKRVPSRDL